MTVARAWKLIEDKDGVKKYQNIFKSGQFKYVYEKTKGVLVAPNSRFVGEISQSSDDCMRYWNNGTTNFSITNTGFTAGQDGSGWKYGCAARFQNVQLNKSATILSARLILTAKSDYSATTMYTNIKGEAADNAATFSDLTDFDARSWTSEVVAWDSIGSWTQNKSYYSPEIRAIIKEITQRAGWSSGNSIVIYWLDDGCASSVARGAYSYDNTDSNKIAPMLEIVFDNVPRQYESDDSEELAWRNTHNQTFSPADNDTYINELSPTSNYDTDNDLIVKELSGTSRHALLGFDFSDLSEADINSATLKLYYYAAIAVGQDAEGRTYNCSEMLRDDWVSSETTWNQYKSGSNWTTAGCNSDGNDYTTTNQVQSTVPVVGNWQSWTPTDIVTDAQSNHSGIVRFVIRDNSSGEYGAKYRSSNYSTDKPQLVINHTDYQKRLGQTFITRGGTNYLFGGAAKLKRVGSTLGINLVFELFAVDANHKPTGSALGSGTIAYDDISTTQEHWYRFRFDSPISVSEYTEYALICRRSDNGSSGTQYCLWYYANGSDHIPEWYALLYEQTSWTTYTDKEYCFSIIDRKEQDIIANDTIWSQGVHEHAQHCAIYNDERVYFAYQKYAGASDYDICAGQYTIANRNWEDSTKVADVTGLQDSHNYPSIIADVDGYLHIFQCIHNSYLYHWKSTNTWDTSSWGARQEITITGPDGTYAHPILDSSGYLWCFFRGQTSGESDRTISYVKATNTAGTTWGSQVDLVDAGTNWRAYIKRAYVAPNGDIHVIWTYYDITNAKFVDVGWMYTDDEGTTWKDHSGSLSLPVARADTEDVYSGDHPLAMDIVCNSSSEPLILYERLVLSATNRYKMCFAYYDTGWTSVDIDEFPNSLRLGRMYLEDDSNIEVISMVITPEISGYQYAEIRKYLSVNAGVSWDSGEQIDNFSGIDPNENLMMPQYTWGSRDIIWGMGNSAPGMIHLLLSDETYNSIFDFARMAQHTVGMGINSGIMVGVG